MNKPGIKSFKWFAVVYLAFIVTSVFIAKTSVFNGQVLRSDGLGYYLYLPAVFIYDNPDYAFCDTVFNEHPKYQKGTFDRVILNTPEGESINKYPPGVAIVSLPFFAVAHAYGSIIGQNKGYETHYQWAWQIASMFHIGLGLFFIFVIGRLKQSHWFVVSLVSIGTLWGTNLFHFATFDAGYSHAFTFAWVSAACYFLIKGGRYYPLAALALGIVFLIRPFNLVLIPAILLATIPFKSWLYIVRSQTSQVIGSIVVFALCIGVYLLTIYWQTGTLWTYPYVDEAFHFDSPHFFKFLFGFEIGAFVYSPLYLFLIGASVWFTIKNGSVWNALAVLSIFLIVSYVLSCWHMWTFGCTLGNRPLVDFMVIFVVPILLYAPKTGYKWYWVTLWTVVVGLGIGYNQIIHYQYRAEIINWCDMNKQRFMDVFLRTSDDYKYFTANDRQFTKSINEQVLDTFISKRMPLYVVDMSGEKTLLDINTEPLLKKRKHRFRFEMEGKFMDRRTDIKLIAFVTKKEGEYLDFQQMLLKKDLVDSGKWLPVVFEFEIPETDGPNRAYFKLRDLKGTDLKVRNVRCTLISYDEKLE